MLRILNKRGRAQKLADVSSPALIGMLGLWPAATPPVGWLICDGSSFSAVTYPTLATVLGGTTLPDMRGRTAPGVGTHGDVSAAGSNDGLAVGSRAWSHGHSPGGSAHSHSASHTHTATAHTHGTVDAHSHASVAHTHNAQAHSHGSTGSTGNATQGQSASIVGSGTSTHAVAHTHTAGTLAGDSNTPGPHTGYNNAVNGGQTSSVNPGTTGSAAPADHAAAAINTDSALTGSADAASVPFCVLHWIVRAA